MTWLAKAGCAEHHVAVLERLVNSFPPEWLLPPQSGEIFENLEHCNRRLRAFVLATGFDIVRKGGGTKAFPSWRFFCFYHGTETRNDRKLEARVEIDEEGNITSKRQRDSKTFSSSIVNGKDFARLNSSGNGGLVRRDMS